MFDSSLPGPQVLRDLDDAALVIAVQDWDRAASAAEARKLAAVAELGRRRTGESQHPIWVCDDWDATAAEIACALTLGHGRALGQMDLAIALRDKFPRIGELFLAGEIGVRTVTAIYWRTMLVHHADVLDQLDAALARKATRWGTLSKYKLEQAIDVCVHQIDPDAVRKVRNTTRCRDFTVGDPDDAAGTASVWGRLDRTDAALLEQRVSAMARGVCDDDPRTLAQRRADAVGALAANSTHLACRCGHPDCPAAADDGRASSVVVHVVAERESLSEPADPMLDGDGLAPADPAAPPQRKAAVIPGVKNGILPAPILAGLIAHGAKVRFVGDPEASSEPRYRPSTALQEFVRTRDLTCRFPGCDRPAVFADIDHTTPYPAGSTHPGNLKCYCRLHHLLKTFWVGWTDRQHADGTVEVTTPTGLSYTTKPFGAVLFPSWNTTTPPPPATGSPPTSPGRELMMPTRSQPRTKARKQRIDAERALNAAERIADENDDPPPF